MLVPLLVLPSVALITILSSLLLLWWKQLYKYERLNIPGPKPLPIIGNVLEFGTQRDGIFDKTRALADKYGTMFRIYFGPKSVGVFLSDPELMKQLITSRENINKSEMYSFFEPMFKTGLVLANGDKWRKSRKLLTPSFHFSILENFNKVFNSAADKLVDILKEQEGRKIDIHPFLNINALHIICETAMGIDFYKNYDLHVRYMNMVHKILEIAMERQFSLFKRSDILFRLTPDYRKQQKYLQFAHSYADSVILQKMEERKHTSKTEEQSDDFGSSKKTAFLDLLLDLYDTGDYNIEDVKQEVDTFIFAGHGTISTALSFTIFELSKYPIVQDLAFEELSRVLGDENDSFITLQKLNELKYLECIIKEGMRLHSPVPFVERTLQRDEEMNGIKLPKGTNINIFIYHMHRSAELYENPDDFKPERFLENDRHVYAYLPFMAGPRNCIGMRYAMFEMKCTLAKLIWNYKILRADDNFKLELLTDGTLKSKNGLPAIFKARK